MRWREAYREPRATHLARVRGTLGFAYFFIEAHP